MIEPREVTKVEVRPVSSTESDRWDEFVSGRPSASLLQSWDWGEFRSGHGWRPVRIAAFRDGQIAGAAQLLIRSAFGASIAYVPRGPVVSFAEPEVYGPLLRSVHRISIKHRAIFLKLEPNEPESPELDRTLLGLGFRRSDHTVQPRATLVVELEGTEEELLSRMRGKTRYGVRRAERSGIEVREGTTEEDLRSFYELMLLTSRRQSYPVRSLEYYRDVLERFRRRDRGALLLAEADGRALAGLMTFVCGDTGVYMYSASSGERSRDTPTYLLQWRAMQWCKRRGCSRYDLWGIPLAAARGEQGPEDEEGEHGYWGVYRYKQKFGGEPLVYAGAYDYPYVRPMYWAWSRLRRDGEE